MLHAFKFSIKYIWVTFRSHQNEHCSFLFFNFSFYNYLHLNFLYVNAWPPWKFNSLHCLGFNRHLLTFQYFSWLCADASYTFSRRQIWTAGRAHVLCVYEAKSGFCLCPLRPEIEWHCNLKEKLFLMLWHPNLETHQKRILWRG